MQWGGYASILAVGLGGLACAEQGTPFDKPDHDVRGPPCPAPAATTAVDADPSLVPDACSRAGTGDVCPSVNASVADVHVTTPNGEIVFTRGWVHVVVGDIIGFTASFNSADRFRLDTVPTISVDMPYAGGSGEAMGTIALKTCDGTLKVEGPVTVTAFDYARGTPVAGSFTAQSADFTAEGKFAFCTPCTVTNSY
jgi:hypothetical protein